MADKLEQIQRETLERLGRMARQHQDERQRASEGLDQIAKLDEAKAQRNDLDKLCETHREFYGEHRPCAGCQAARDAALRRGVERLRDNALAYAKTIEPDILRAAYRVWFEGLDALLRAGEETTDGTPRA